MFFHIISAIVIPWPFSLFLSPTLFWLFRWLRLNDDYGSKEMKSTFGIFNMWPNTDWLQPVYDYKAQFIQTNPRDRELRGLSVLLWHQFHVCWLTRQTVTRCDGSLRAHNEIMVKCLIRRSFSSFSAPSLSLSFTCSVACVIVICLECCICIDSKGKLPSFLLLHCCHSRNATQYYMIIFQVLCIYILSHTNRYLSRGITDHSCLLTCWTAPLFASSL